MPARKGKLKIHKIRDFEFNKVPYKIVWKKKRFKPDDCYAEVESPDSKSPKMWIGPEAHKKDSKLLLKALLDESFHVYQFHVDNDFVDKYSSEVSQFLHDIGFHVDQKE
jgi:hypothetical protein